MQPIDHIIKNNPKLNKLVSLAQELKKLDPLFQAMLPRELRKHCHLTKIEKNALTVAIDAASWATKFRYVIPDLLKDLRTQPEFHQVEKIYHHVFAETSIPETSSSPLAKKLQISKETALLLEKTARGIKNKKLQKSLEKLAISSNQ
jgi:hypothetical protein